MSQQDGTPQQHPIEDPTLRAGESTLAADDSGPVVDRDYRSTLGSHSYHEGSDGVYNPYARAGAGAASEADQEYAPSGQGEDYTDPNGIRYADASLGSGSMFVVAADNDPGYGEIGVSMEYSGFDDLGELGSDTASPAHDTDGYPDGSPKASKWGNPTTPPANWLGG